MPWEYMRDKGSDTRQIYVDEDGKQHGHPQQVIERDPWSELYPTESCSARSSTFGNQQVELVTR